MPTSLIDTHVHAWDLAKARYAWLDGDTSLLNRTYRLEELDAERRETGVSEAVLVQAANNAEDTALMLDIARETGWISGVVGWLPLQDPAATEKALSEIYRKNPVLKGCRHLIHNEADPRWLLQDRVIESLSLVARQGLTYDIVGVLDEHLVTALRVAEKIPALKIAIDHLNQPPFAGRGSGRWSDLMKEAAGHPQFFAKISGLGTATGLGYDWTADDIRPQVSYVLETFGTSRCFCGGDWPVSLLAGSYKDTWAAYLNILGALPEQDQNRVLSENARQFYGLQGGNR